MQHQELRNASLGSVAMQARERGEALRACGLPCCLQSERRGLKLKLGFCSIPPSQLPTSCRLQTSSCVAPPGGWRKASSSSAMLAGVLSRSTLMLSVTVACSSSSSAGSKPVPAHARKLGLRHRKALPEPPCLQIDVELEDNKDQLRPENAADQFACSPRVRRLRDDKVPASAQSGALLCDACSEVAEKVFPRLQVDTGPLGNLYKPLM